MNAVKLPKLPEPVDAISRAAWGPKPDYYTADQMNARYLKGYEDARAAVEASQPSAAVTEAKDAARYRWLRDAGGPNWLNALMMMAEVGPTDKEVDAAIDAALSQRSSVTTTTDSGGKP